MPTRVCPACGNRSKEVNHPAGMTEYSAATGFIPVSVEGGSTVWLCAICASIVRRFAESIVEIVGEEKIRFSDLLKPKEEVDGSQENSACVSQS
ncbi:MAG: hypothetical protein Q7S19_00430 [bacterium]|nr:hypothetical protein [bacterium]